MRWKQWRVGAILPAAALLAGTLAALPGSAVASPAASPTSLKWGLCSATAHGASCLDASSVYGPVGYNGKYVGHDEPSVLFYSNRAGSGNNNNYLLKLPKDPPVAPNQSATGGTDNFQLHPAFWFGMAMCDSQSFPEYTTNCPADSDSNIANSPDPASPQYIGKHTGTAFMEMQFYPPGWVPWPAGNSCAATDWCAALNIDSLSQNPAGTLNNASCQNTVGTEYVNFAFITKNGVAQAPANPLNATGATYTPDPQRDLFMKSGDTLSVRMYDTQAGFRVDITDLTAHLSGSMTASPANGFAQVNYQPTASSCSVTPYAFHPMYATSGPTTRVPWAAHSYNVAFADEIGHFEYCATATATGGCSAAGVSEKNGALDNDDVGCFPPAASTLIQVSGCLGTDNDFDGPEYAANWPGTGTRQHQKQYDATPITFTSPTFNGFERYSQVAFEADLPRIEYANVGGPGPLYCDPTTGANCVNPPPGASFYPIFTTARAGFACVWREGGANLPGVTNSFGGSSKTEYKNLTTNLYATVVNGQPAPQYKYENYRQILPYNPC